MEDLAVRDLVHMAQEGNQGAWSELVRRFASLVYSIARRHGLNDAACADVSQTTWLKLAENLDRIREPARIAGWLATTSRNESLNVIRRTKNETFSDSYEEQLAAPDDPAGDVIHGERAEVLWGAVRQLSQQCQLLLALLFNQPDLGYNDIASVLGISVGSIGPTRSRCLAKARAALGTNYDHS